jgi:outer membrane protein TolC
MVSAKLCQQIVPQQFGKEKLSLADLIDIALQNNPATKQTWAAARTAAAQYGQTLSPFLPQIDGQLSFIRSRTTGISFGGDPLPFYYTQAGPDLLLSYTLFDFGQRTAKSLAAREALYYADWSHNQQLQNVIQLVMADYYTYLYEQEALKAQEANLQNAQASLDAANERFALGLAALGDVAQARTQYLQSKIGLNTQKQTVENAFAQLATGIGLPANIPFEVLPWPEAVETAPILQGLAELVEIAQTQRQDFLAAQAELRYREMLLLQAERASLPVVTTNLDIGRYNFQNGAQETTHWSAIVNVAIPLFRGYYFRNGIRAAEAEVSRAEAQVVQTELSIIQQVTTSKVGVETASKNLADSAEYLKAAELEFEIALASYKAGTNTILDLLSAQSSVADARSKKAEAIQGWYTSLATLAYATGSLCAPPQEAAPLSSEPNEKEAPCAD